MFLAGRGVEGVIFRVSCKCAGCKGESGFVGVGVVAGHRLGAGVVMIFLRSFLPSFAGKVTVGDGVADWVWWGVYISGEDAEGRWRIASADLTFYLHRGCWGGHGLRVEFYRDEIRLTG